MTKKLSKFLIALIIIPIMLGLGSCAFADDTTGNTGVFNPVTGEEITESGVYGFTKTGLDCYTATKYTVTIFNEDGTKNTWSQILSKGKQIGDSEIKGYTWYNMGTDAAYLAPQKSQINVERADVVALLSEYGQSTLAKKAETSYVELIIEPCINVKKTPDEYMGVMTVYEWMKNVSNIKSGLTSTKNNSSYSLRMAETTGGYEGDVPSLKYFYAEYHAPDGVPLREIQLNCWEEEENAHLYNKYTEFQALLENGIISTRLSDNNLGSSAYYTEEGARFGWSGYSFEAESVDEPEITIDAGVEESFTYAKIDNDTFNVYSSESLWGNSVPTEETLYIDGKSNLYGFVEGLKITKYDVGSDKFNGTITVEYPELKNGKINYTTKSYTYNNTGAYSDEYRYISWIDSSGATFSKDFDLVIENAAFADAKQVFNSINDLKISSASFYKMSSYGSSLDVSERVTKNSSTVTKTISMDSRDKEVLEELYELSKSGSSTATSRLNSKILELQEKALDNLYSLNHFYVIKSDAPRVTIAGKFYSVTENGAVIGSLYDVERTNLPIAEDAENKSTFTASGCLCYVTESDIIVGSKVKEDNILAPDHNRVNHVRIHTPISNQTTVTGGSAVNGDSSRIKVTQGNTIKVDLSIINDSEYYDAISGFDITKYIKSKEIICGICGKTITTGSHSCTIPSAAADGTVYTITTKVVAKNIGTKDPELYAGIGEINIPDNEYALMKSYNIGVNVEPPETTPPATPPTTPTPTPTGTTTPTPTPDTEYEFEKLDDPDCSKTFDAEMKLDNTQFKVLSGHSIPTSEDLVIDGNTNLLGKIKGIEEWRVKIPGKSYNVNATYTKNYYVTVTREESTYDITFDTYSEASQHITDFGGAYDSISGPYENVGNYTAIATIPDSYITFRYTADAVAGSVNKVETDSGILINSHILPLNKTVKVRYETDNTSKIPAADDSRVIQYRTEYNMGKYSSLSSLESALSTLSLDVTDFWKVTSDSGSVYISINGGAETLYDDDMDNNCPIVDDTNDRTFHKADDCTIKLIPNDTNPGYPNSAEHIIDYDDGVSEHYGTIPGNDVKVHTPIYNDLAIESLEPNQLSSGDLRQGNKIVTLDEPFKATVTVYPAASSWKYSDISNVNYYKYVKEVRINCSVCGQTLTWTETSGPDSNRAGTSSTFVHECTPDPTKVNDNTTPSITSTVIAENQGTGGADLVETTKKHNDSDSEYADTQSQKVYIAGKIYDFKVRTTDDTAWRLSSAQTLAQLPIGEKGDNANTVNKYGIKLGYRAYFDLKTLGTATNTVNLTPQIYYITTAGAVKTSSEFKLYYRDSSSKTSYKELSAQDIVIDMKMSSTNGAVNNTDYSTELGNTLKLLNSSLNLNKSIKLAGLVGPITLTSDNVFMTKYQGSYITGTPSASRRWYGEIYVPASAVVTTKDAKVTDIIQGNSKVYKTGYLLVTFEPIEAMIGDSTYLRYDYSKDSEWNTHSDDSVLIQEKNGKSSINLPGSGTASVPNNDISAPVIIYDVSLRANDDYESTGTH